MNPHRPLDRLTDWQIPETLPMVALRYLGPDALPWLASLLETYEAMEGRPLRELRSRVRPVLTGVPPAHREVGVEVLDRLYGTVAKGSPPPRELRKSLFVAAQDHAREHALALAAEEHAVTPEELEQRLFADLGEERALGRPKDRVSPSELMLRVNLAQVQRQLRLARWVEVEVEGHARDLLRYIRTVGLLATIHLAAGAPEALPLRAPPEPGALREPPGGYVLRISGPLALFRRTRVYAGALGQLVPRLAWAKRFRLRALIEPKDHPTSVLLVESGDPVFPAAEPNRYDSKLEARFAKAFIKATADWGLLREPAPIRVGDEVMFVDFEIQSRHDPGRRWWMEIAGYWTEAYLDRKLRLLREVGLRHLIVALDERQKRRISELPEGAEVVWFKRSIDPKAVLRILGQASDSASSPDPTGRSLGGTGRPGTARRR